MLCSVTKISITFLAATTTKKIFLTLIMNTKTTTYEESIPNQLDVMSHNHTHVKKETIVITFFFGNIAQNQRKMQGTTNI